MTLSTTLRLLRQYGACGSRDTVPPSGRYAVLFVALGPRWRDDRPIPLLRILATNGLDDALWALRAVPPEQEAERDRLARLYAVDCSRRTLRLIPPGEEWPACAVGLAELYACGLEGVTAEDLAAIWAAAVDAAWDAAYDAARVAAYDAARVAERAWQAEHLRQMLGGQP